MSGGGGGVTTDLITSGGPLGATITFSDGGDDDGSVGMGSAYPPYPYTWTQGTAETMSVSSQPSRVAAAMTHEDASLTEQMIDTLAHSIQGLVEEAVSNINAGRIPVNGSKEEVVQQLQMVGNLKLRDLGVVADVVADVKRSYEITDDECSTLAEYPDIERIEPDPIPIIPSGVRELLTDNAAANPSRENQLTRDLADEVLSRESHSLQNYKVPGDIGYAPPTKRAELESQVANVCTRRGIPVSHNQVAQAREDQSAAAAVVLDMVTSGEEAVPMDDGAVDHYSFVIVDDNMYHRRLDAFSRQYCKKTDLGLGSMSYTQKQNAAGKTVYTGSFFLKKKMAPEGVKKMLANNKRIKINLTPIRSIVT